MKQNLRMKVFRTIKELQDSLKKLNQSKKEIGFVPTMGALHEGHLSLIKRSKNENEVTVCSIFVNSVQFNNKEDLANYPRTIEKDIELLEKEKCDMLFYPADNEIFQFEKPDISKYNFGYMESCMEGLFRPGHFKGVAYIVHLLFRIINPDKAYFGQKDYQQLIIIKELVKQYNLPVKIVPCPTVRESNGLAMSSRNIRLSEKEKNAAGIISKTLYEINNNNGHNSVTTVKNLFVELLNKNPLITVQYFDIVNADNLKSVDSWDRAKNIIGCVAAIVGKTRLIDNVFIAGGH